MKTLFFALGAFSCWLWHAVDRWIMEGRYMVLAFAGSMTRAQ